jgi:hypothetical protein
MRTVYPKSLAMDLHSDSICLEEPGAAQQKVSFEPFIGIGPRRYADLFSTTTREGTRIRRKDGAGRVVEGETRIRLSMRDKTYIQREADAAQELWDFIGNPV